MPLDRLAQHLRRFPPEPVGEDPSVPRAAVAAVFRPGPDLLFIRRSERPGDPWSGHMAFPGGRASPGDPSTRHTAERESQEEVGLDLAQEGALLGELQSLVTPMRRTRLPPLVVVPYVYALARAPALAPNGEVASIHWFPLQRLLDGEGRGTMVYDVDGATFELPCIRLDGTLIWGMTLRLVDELLERSRTSDPPSFHEVR